jgi:hypothetical protein
MKTIILSAAAAFSLAAPAFADDGAFYSGERSQGDPAFVIVHFDQDGDTWRSVVGTETDTRVSTSNQDLAEFAAKKLDNGERGDN